MEKAVCYGKYKTEELEALYQALLEDRIPIGTPLDKIRAMDEYIRQNKKDAPVFQETSSSSHKIKL